MGSPRLAMALLMSRYKGGKRAPSVERDEMLDDEENYEQRQTGPEAPADQFLFDRQQRFRGARRFAQIGFGHRSSLKSGRERRLDAGEEEPRDDKPDPDDEPEQHQVDRRQLGESVLPELTEVRHHADREEGQHEENHAQHIGFADRRGELARRASGRPQRKRQGHEERRHEAENELRESLPNLGESRL